MASFQSNSLSEPATVEQVITEFFTKSVHIILESRSPYVSSRNYSGEQFSSSPSSSSSSSSVRPRDKWFNLALKDWPAALENFDLWRQSNAEPVVIDVILTRRSSPPDVAVWPSKRCPLRSLSLKDRFSNWASGRDDFAPGTRSEKIVERWTIQYESRKSVSSMRELYSGSKKGGNACSQSSELPAMYRKTYKKSIIMLRSLYSTVRLLPAYKVFRDLNSSNQIHPFSLSHGISSFVESFTRKEEAEMKQFVFTPVDTPCGRLCLSVSYLPTLDDVSLEASPPLYTQFIPDYVSSPTTDPLKRFQSLPSSLPTYVSYSRHHSWGNEQGGTRLVSPSPSPTCSNSHAFLDHPDQCHTRHNYSQADSPTACSVPSDALATHRKNTSFDDYWPSPPFSPSSSPSPPAHFPAGHQQNFLSRTESAPVNIPFPRPGRSNTQLNHGLPRSPSRSKNTRPGSSLQADIVKAHVATSPASQTSISEIKLHAKKNQTRAGEFQINMALQKVLSFGKDEPGSLAGLKIQTCSSPRIPFSRSSSRLSFLDDIDDSEFACPFAVDDVDVGDSCNRTESLDGRGCDMENLNPIGLSTTKKSPDAAVSALVQMLKTAPPLHQDSSESTRTLRSFKDDTWNQRVEPNRNVEDGVGKLCSMASPSATAASGLFKSRTAADALEELQNYKEIKESLLRQGASQILDGAHPSKSTSAD